MSFNKKGTSLVELIAVIVIMGIIAGIAVPVTIAVINRQKKNAAAKSAEAVVATMKQLTQELIAQATSTVEITLAYPTEGTTTANVPTNAIVKIDNVAQTGYPASEFVVENLKARGTITSTYYVVESGTGESAHGAGTYSFDSTSFTVSGYTITVAADGSATASSN